jgi:hypothetical protein
MLPALTARRIGRREIAVLRMSGEMMLPGGATFAFRIGTIQ